MGWTLFFMVVILKIPLAAACYLVWWAIKEEPVPEDGVSDDEHGPRRKPPRRPRWPRRGPFGGGAGCKASPCPSEAGSRLERHAPAHARRS